MKAEVPRSMSGFRRSCWDTWWIFQDLHTNWTHVWVSLWGNYLCSLQWWLPWGHRIWVKPHQRSLLGSNRCSFPSSFLFQSSSPRNRLLPGRCRSTSLCLPSWRLPGAFGDFRVRGGGPSSGKTGIWYQRTTWWRWLSGLGRRYFEDVDQQFTFVIVDEFWLLLDYHAQIRSH